MYGDGPPIEIPFAQVTGVTQPKRPRAIGIQPIVVVRREGQVRLPSLTRAYPVLQESGFREMIQADVKLLGAVVVEVDLHVYLGHGGSSRCTTGKDNVLLHEVLVFNEADIVILPAARGQGRSDDRPRDTRNECLGNSRLVTSRR